MEKNLKKNIKEYKYIYIYVYIVCHIPESLNHAIYLNHCKSTILQFKSKQIRFQVDMNFGGGHYSTYYTIFWCFVIHKMPALLSEPARYVLALFDTESCKTTWFGSGTGPRSPSQQVVESSFSAQAYHPVASQVSSGILCTSGPGCGPMGSWPSLDLQELELQVAAGGPLQVGSEAIRTW